jgi:hypothetical protein
MENKCISGAETSGMERDELLGNCNAASADMSTANNPTTASSAGLLVGVIAGVVLILATVAAVACRLRRKQPSEQTVIMSTFKVNLARQSTLRGERVPTDDASQSGDASYNIIHQPSVDCDPTYGAAPTGSTHQTGDTDAPPTVAVSETVIDSVPRWVGADSTAVYSRIVDDSASAYQYAIVGPPIQLSAQLASAPKLPLTEAIEMVAAHCACDAREWVDRATAFATAATTPPNASDLTVEEVSAIHIYTQDTPLFNKLNEALRELGAGNTALVPHYLPYTNTLLKALTKLERVSVEKTLYRGIKRDYKDVIGPLLEGDELVWDAFSSTTQSPDVLQNNNFLGTAATEGRRTVFQLHVRNGVCIQQFSAFGGAAAGQSEQQQQLRPQPLADSESPDEEEVLVLPCVRLRILSIRECPNDITEIRMEEIEPLTDGPWWLERSPLSPADFVHPASGGVGLGSMLESNRTEDFAVASVAPQPPFEEPPVVFDPAGVYLMPDGYDAGAEREGDPADLNGFEFTDC